jgi:hypothetical protein
MRLGKRVTLLAVAVTTALVPATAATAAAPENNRPRVTVVATGLDNPRGIIAGPDGTLLVAEAGKGGTGKCLPSPEGGESCFGLSSAVTLVWPKKGGWGQKRVVTGLPSIADKDGSGALGLHDLAWGRGGLFGTIGLGGSPETRTAFGPDAKLMGHVVWFGPKKVVPVADLTGFEAKNNPDAKDAGSAVDSNPYGLLATSHGLVATDAGGNDVLAIDKRGKIKVITVLHKRDVQNGNTKVAVQAVPTSVVRGPDGALYVGQLTGFPFVKGAAKVWRVVPGHKPTVYASGFTNIIDIAFDRWGRLLVLEISKNGLLTNDPTGALIRVDHGKQTELVPGKLTLPGGLLIGRDALYVTNKSVFPGGGEVLRIKL